MIKEIKQDAALKSLQAIIIKARTMAYQENRHKRIADLLDGAEYLIALMMDPSDTTELYRAYVKEMSEEFSCHSAFAAFEADTG